MPTCARVLVRAGARVGELHSEREVAETGGGSLVRREWCEAEASGLGIGFLARGVHGSGG